MTSRTDPTRPDDTDTDTLHITQLQRTRMLALIGDFAPIGSFLSMSTRLQHLQRAEQRIRDDAFVVLVLGEFNRGKSTLINALLGRKLLPAFATETTATVCEVRFGETPRALLYPSQPPGTAAFEVNVDDIERYVVVDEDEPERPSPYEKMELYWPLRLCRNGVMVVDSPGMNKSAAHEDRTVRYLRSADAIVFVSDCQNAWSRSEVGFVKQLPPSIEPFFVFNKINLIEDEEQDRVRRSIRRHLGTVRPDGLRRLYFVDAKRALKAAGNEAEIDAAGVGEFVRDLQRFLATERARVKIGGPARELAEAVREARKQIPVRRGNATMSLQELEDKVNAQRGPLEALKERRTAILGRIDEAAGYFTRDVERALRGFLKNTAGQLPDWAERCTVAAKLSINPLKVRESTEAFSAEVAKLLEERIADAYLAWRDGDLSVLMQSHVETLAEDLTDDLAAFEQGLERVRNGLLSEGMRYDGSGTDLEGTPLAKTLAAAGGMLISGPAGAFVGARLGPTQMLKNAIPQIVVGAGILLFTPLGWVAAASAMAVVAVLQVVFGVEALEQKIKRKVGEELGRVLTSQAADRSHQFADEVASELGKVRNSIGDGLAVRIEEVQSQFDALLAARNQTQAELSATQAALDDIEQRLNVLDAEIADLMGVLGGTGPLEPNHGQRTDPSARPVAADMS